MTINTRKSLRDIETPAESTISGSSFLHIKPDTRTAVLNNHCPTAQMLDWENFDNGQGEKRD